jgi:hypothetical protein
MTEDEIFEISKRLTDVVADEHDIDVLRAFTLAVGNFIMLHAADREMAEKTVAATNKHLTDHVREFWPEIDTLLRRPRQ